MESAKEYSIKIFHKKLPRNIHLVQKVRANANQGKPYGLAVCPRRNIPSKNIFPRIILPRNIHLVQKVRANANHGKPHGLGVCPPRLAGLIGLLMAHCKALPYMADGDDLYRSKHFLVDYLDFWS